MAKIYQSSATVILPRASRTVLCKATMKPVVPAEVREEVMLRETETGLGSLTKSTTKTITELLRMETLGSVVDEVVTIIAQLEVVVIEGAVVVSETKKSPILTLPTKLPSKTEIISVMTSDLLVAEGTLPEAAKVLIS